VDEHRRPQALSPAGGRRRHGERARLAQQRQAQRRHQARADEAVRCPCVQQDGHAAYAIRRRNESRQPRLEGSDCPAPKGGTRLRPPARLTAPANFSPWHPRRRRPCLPRRSPQSHREPPARPKTLRRPRTARSLATDTACPATSPSATSCGQLALPALTAGRRAEGATLSPKGMAAKVGGYLPPARLELSTALQRPVVLPGQGQARPAALSGWGASASSRRLPSGAANPHPHRGKGVQGSWARAWPVRNS
jgi:hypothetical protein